MFYASSKSNNGVSLNDCLIQGPDLNPLVLDLILRLRQYRYEFSGDIEKDFIQIGLSEINRTVLRFLYFDNDYS